MSRAPTADHTMGRSAGGVLGCFRGTDGRFRDTARCSARPGAAASLYDGARAPNNSRIAVSSSRGSNGLSSVRAAPKAAAAFSMSICPVWPPPDMATTLEYHSDGTAQQNRHHPSPEFLPCQLERSLRRPVGATSRRDPPDSARNRRGLGRPLASSPSHCVIRESHKQKRDERHGASPPS